MDKFSSLPVQHWSIRLRLELLAIIPGSCPTRLKAADATLLFLLLYDAHHRVLCMEVTASGRPAMMRRSMHKRLACVLTTSSLAGSLPEPPHLG